MRNHFRTMESPHAPTSAYFGEPVKLIRTTKAADGTETAVLGGYLVKFSGPEDPDLEGDFFTADTDFGTLSRRGTTTLPAYYQHGFDAYFGNKAIGDADARLDEFGVWAEYQIELRSEYERHLVEMASKGLLGQSSGAVGHLVERKQVGPAWHFKTWPLGEASLTPTPAEPRTSAMPMKAFKEWAQAQGTIPTTPAATTAPGGAVAAPTQKTATAQPPPDMEQDTKATPEVKATEPTNDGALVSLDDIKAVVSEQFKALREDMKPAPAAVVDTGAPALIKSGLGDTEAKAFKAWAMGDDGAMKHAQTGMHTIAVKASNNTDMNIGTAADGGNAVPTGHFNGIIARRDENRLALPFRQIPGVGTTVNVPLDAEADGEFVATNEAAANDRDAPALGTVAMTLVKYTKRVELSNELMQDEESRLMAFLEDFIGRGMAKTHNQLAMAEVIANGATLKTTASATAVAAGELEDVVLGDTIAHYLDNQSAWVMRPSTYSAIAKLTGNNRLYVSQAQGSGISLTPQLLGYGVQWSQALEAYGTAENEFAAFGNFNYVGVREEPSFEVLRDPYSAATTGQLRLHYYFRTVYKVLQSEAVGTVVHAAA